MTKSKKPNLVFMFADQLRLCSMGYYGDRKAITPNIDALEKRSLNLTGAVSGHPVCAPYRASLLTGKYTTSTGMVINEIRLCPDHRSFAHVLNDNDYNTAENRINALYEELRDLDTAVEEKREKISENEMYCLHF